MKLYHFLGSVYFAIILIATTLLFVIAGTIIESVSGSHLYAATFTYSSPVFQTLLWLYVVNILISTLRRYPFKWRHIPFIITHIGLLMILGGVLVKSHFGVQGAMAITEGSGGQHIVLPNSYALLVQNRQERTLLPLQSDMHHKDLSIKLLDWTDHAEEQLDGFFKQGWVHVLGLPPLELNGKPLRTTHYTLYAQTKAPTFPGHAALYFLPDEFVAFNAHGEKHTASYDTYLVFDKGYEGYGAYLPLPDNFSPIELMAPLTRRSVAKTPHKKKEELTPRIRLLVSDEERAEMLTLTYDKYATSFRWPVLGGKYLLRFQSMEQEIPHKIRLRSARQINYPGTQTPYSYEADLLVDGTPATLSMNNVYEKNGYRYYLSNLISAPMRAHKVQIVVNHDPAKYVLTYPGAIVLACGMLLLYLRRRYG